MNNPLMYTDPSGYTWFTQLGGWLGGTGKTIAETVVGIGVGIAVTALTGGLDLITVGVLCGMAAGASTGILNTAFSGGNFNDYLNSMCSGAVIGAFSGLASSAALAGIGAAWDAIGNMHLPESDLGQDFWGTPNYPTSAWSNNWLVKTYQFISNIGNGAANASIAGSSTGALASGIGSGGLASLGSQELTGLNMNLFPKPTLAIDNNLVLEFHFTNTGNGYSRYGTASIYSSNGDLLGENHVNYSIHSGAANIQAYSIPEEVVDATGYEPLTFSNTTADYFNANHTIGFKVRLADLHGRTHMLIHPTTSWTAGCMGLSGPDDELADFQERMYNYFILQGHHHMDVRVIPNVPFND